MDDKIVPTVAHPVALARKIIGNLTDLSVTFLGLYSAGRMNDFAIAGLFCPSTSTAEPISARQPALRPHVHKQPEKTTRVRTVLNEKQLHTLRTCYNANPRPDALMKEQLVEMTGLSPRVIRVWFQNKRCKDKKKSILMKQLQQQQHSDKTVSIFVSLAA